MYTVEYYSTIKEGKPVIFSNMDKYRVHYIKRHNLVSERQILHDLTYGIYKSWLDRFWEQDGGYERLVRIKERKECGVVDQWVLSYM
jgi:ribosomal protein L17